MRAADRGRRSRERVKLVEGRPLDRAAVAQAAPAIDSLYRDAGLLRRQVKVIELPQADGQVRLVFDVDEGSRVAISQVDDRGQRAVLRQGTSSSTWAPGPRASGGSRRASTTTRSCEQDLRERLPTGTATTATSTSRCSTTRCSADSRPARPTLALTVDEGAAVPRRHLRDRRQPAVLDRGAAAVLPLRQRAAAGRRHAGRRPPFNRVDVGRGHREGAGPLRQQRLHLRPGRPDEIRRTGADGTPVVDLRWVIQRGRSRRRQQDRDRRQRRHPRAGDPRARSCCCRATCSARTALIRSLPEHLQPRLLPAAAAAARRRSRPTNRVDVDIVFRVEEKRTGNINFGASVGQGTGRRRLPRARGAEPLRPGQARASCSGSSAGTSTTSPCYTDPAIRESRISGTLTLFNSAAALHHRRPGPAAASAAAASSSASRFFGSRYTRLFISYGLTSRSATPDGSDGPAAARSNCSNCIRSTLGLQPASATPGSTCRSPPAGAIDVIGLELNGGVLGGTGDYQQARPRRPLVRAAGPAGRRRAARQRGPVRAGPDRQVRVRLRRRGPFFTELFSLGGVQFGIPLRGYDEFSITPNGFDPLRQRRAAAQPGRVRQVLRGLHGRRSGARISQSLYVERLLRRRQRVPEPAPVRSDAGCSAARASGRP